MTKATPALKSAMADHARHQAMGVIYSATCRECRVERATSARELAEEQRAARELDMLKARKHGRRAGREE